MASQPHKRWRWFLVPLLLLSTWPGLAFLLGAISLNAPPADPGPESVEIALVSNGWHVDLVLPVEAGGIDWRGDFPARDTALGVTLPFIAIGWGDRDFYLETPRMRDLKLKTALNAVLGQGPTVLHVMHLPGMPRGEGTRRLRVSPQTYRALAERLQASLQRDTQGKTILIGGKGFGHSDAFYEATGHYSPVTTCNEWLAAHLRAAGLPAGLWSPLPSGLTAHWPSN